MTKGEFIDSLIWLNARMDEYDDKEAYQHDYKIVSQIWSFMRTRVPEERGKRARALGNMKAKMEDKPCG